MTTASEALPTVVRADGVPGCRQGRWTYAAYAAIPDEGKRYEVVEGVLYRTPAPNIAHQMAQAGFMGNLYLHVQLAGLARVFSAPTDVELAPRAVVQPDVIVILSAKLSIITTSRIVGAPDLVIEIASPGTAGHDRRTKQDAYTRGGIPEYWIADPATRTIEILRLVAGVYQSTGVFSGDTTLPAGVLPELPVRVEQYFA